MLLVSDIRPVLTRVPVGGGVRALGATFHLVLEIGHFDLISNSGGSVWGEPTGIETHRQVGVWVEGLRGTGAGG